MVPANNSAVPTISCVMLTNSRIAHFRRSFECYRRQSYPNRELIVVSASSAEYQRKLRVIVEECGEPGVRLVFLSSAPALGLLRNISLDHAGGPFVCQWDDDDLYHPDRLKIQMEYMLAEGARISFLCDNFHVLWDSQQLFWCDWTRWDLGGGVLPGSLLAAKSDLPTYSNSLSHHEDTHLVRAIISSGARVAKLQGCGYLYLYGYHGTNTFSRSHHLQVARRWGMPVSELVNRKELICGALRRYAAEYGIGSPLDVVGGREVAFTWSS